MGVAQLGPEEAVIFRAAEKVKEPFKWRMVGNAQERITLGVRLVSVLERDISKDPC